METTVIENKTAQHTFYKPRPVVEKKKMGGARPGAGRPTGKLKKVNHDKIKVQDYMRQRVMRSSYKILNAQMNLAEGTSYLYVIRTNKKGIKEKPELITAQPIIEQYLAGELDGLDDEYYYITTERPDNRAIDSLWDRTFGKVPSTVQGTGTDGEIVIKIVNYANRANDTIQLPASAVSVTVPEGV